jgi:signal transduction histidine kinase
VLDLEKIQNTTSDVPFESVDLNVVVSNSVRGMEQMLRERSIDCRLSLADHPVIVRGNPDRLIQVAVNLLSNAMKFCDPEQGRIDVQLSLHDGRAVLSVRDNGPGIPSSAQDLIFEKFTQVHSPVQGKPEGTGLGLFITRAIINQHGGEIKVKSEPGNGAEFVVELPVAEG